MQQLTDRIRKARDDLESILGRALWLNAPVKVKTNVQSALDALNEILIERPKQKENNPMKELFEMLGKFQNAREAVKGTTERLERLPAACAKFNAGFDQFLEAAEGFEGVFDDSFVKQEATPEEPLEEAAPNGELGDATQEQAANAGIVGAI